MAWYPGDICCFKLKPQTVKKVNLQLYIPCTGYYFAPSCLPYRLFPHSLCSPFPLRCLSLLFTLLPFVLSSLCCHVMQGRVRLPTKCLDGFTLTLCVMCPSSALLSMLLKRQGRNRVRQPHGRQQTATMALWDGHVNYHVYE